MDRRYLHTRAAGFLSAALLCAEVAGADPRAKLAGYRESPVFFEMFFDRYADPTELPALREDRIRIKHYGVFDAAGFDWTSGPSRELTWWIQVEELRFLLPLIGSSDPEDCDRASQWIADWMAAHAAPVGPNAGAWNEPMTVAWRAMVFVCWLRVAYLRGDNDTEMVTAVEAQVGRHADALTKKFSAHSNHGVVEALGLVEASRVTMDPAHSALGFERLGDVMSRSVSPGGVHLERAAHYHFVVGRWLGEFSEYLATLPGAPRGDVHDLAKTARRMRDASWYLNDHAARVVQVGDTDSIGAAEIDPYHTRRRRAKTPVLVDREAGYAVYKGLDRDRRFVLLSTQLRKPPATHGHDDVLAVLYINDGEVLVGDAGRYEYAQTPMRWFFSGPTAHNRPFAASALSRLAPPGMALADSTWSRTTRYRSTLGARAILGGMSWRREVHIRNDAHVAIRDDLRPTGATPDSVISLAWNAGHDVVSFVVTESGPSRIACELRTRTGRVFLLTTEANIDAFLQTQTYRGSLRPMAGWYSPRQKVRRPSSVLVISVSAAQPVRLTTTISPVRQKRTVLGRIMERGH